ncbi:hypothetical protein SKA53_05800 [Yoonia vestfoldensis SKA53]|uniref:Uncharacterized protein n=1 Tax=Yoonia vestfoldensis SKA53 TaxID=314232 RepID=A3V995_9RHOB|nr:hypothetical protein SKA53_05800 [Yoonia vestfoldensis SKA53]
MGTIRGKVLMRMHRRKQIYVITSWAVCTNNMLNENFKAHLLTYLLRLAQTASIAQVLIVAAVAGGGHTAGASPRTPGIFGL